MTVNTGAITVLENKHPSDFSNDNTLLQTEMHTWFTDSCL